MTVKVVICSETISVIIIIYRLNNHHHHHYHHHQHHQSLVLITPSRVFWTIFRSPINHLLLYIHLRIVRIKFYYFVDPWSLNFTRPSLHTTHTHTNTHTHTHTHATRTHLIRPTTKSLRGTDSAQRDAVCYISLDFP